MIHRKARPLDDYPPLVFVPEPPVRDVVRVALCACGGTIVQHADETVPDVIARHNDTREHRGWRRRRR